MVALQLGGFLDAVQRWAVQAFEGLTGSDVNQIAAQISDLVLLVFLVFMFLSALAIVIMIWRYERQAPEMEERRRYQRD